MFRQLRHRQTKGAATVESGLTLPRHISTLPFSPSVIVLSCGGNLALGKLPRCFSTTAGEFINAQSFGFRNHGCNTRVGWLRVGSPSLRSSNTTHGSLCRY